MIKLDRYKISALVCEDEKWKIYRVYDEADNQPMLLKTVNENVLGKGDWVTCQKEFQFIRSLNTFGCRHIINATSMYNDAEGFYMILENFPGRSLQKIHLLKQTEDLNFLLMVAVDLAEAVEHLHFHEFLHNNLHPGVFMVEESLGEVVIVDYASACKNHDNKGIQPGEISSLEVMAQYMSPERTGRTKHNVDCRSDLYSLGIILYELFSRQHPFQTESISGLIHCHLAIRPKPLFEVDSSIPQALSDVISKLLAKDPDDRYQSAYGLKRDLEYCREQWEQQKNIPAIYLDQYEWAGAIHIPDGLY